MYLNKRIIEHPLLSLTNLNSRVDRRHDRRALSRDEFRLLLSAAESGPPVEGITGVDRAMLYFIASYTGLRKSELGSLTKESFCFNNDLMTDNLFDDDKIIEEQAAMVTIEACYSKHRRKDILPLHKSLVAKIKEWLEAKNLMPDELLFPISKRSGGVERKASKMIKFDLDAARTFWIAEATSKEDESKRATSNFLLYRNDKGNFADFHCLRHTFITNLGRAKVPIKTAQTLARHATLELTANIYTHIEQQEQIFAINSLPSYDTNKDDPNTK
jgi:integrase